MAPLGCPLVRALVAWVLLLGLLRDRLPRSSGGVLPVGLLLQLQALLRLGQVQRWDLVDAYSSLWRLRDVLLGEALR